METVLFLAIITVCPILTAICNSADDWVRYISAPFEVEASFLQDACTVAIEELHPEVDIKGATSYLCVREDIWRQNHPEYD